MLLTANFASEIGKKAANRSALTRIGMGQVAENLQ